MFKRSIRQGWREEMLSVIVKSGAEQYLFKRGFG